MDPASIERTYADIERIFKANETEFTTHEEKTPQGTFKSYIVATPVR